MFKGRYCFSSKNNYRSFGLNENVLAFSIAPGFVNTEMAKSFIEKNGEDLVKKGIRLDRHNRTKRHISFSRINCDRKNGPQYNSTIDVNAGSYLR